MTHAPRFFARILVAVTCCLVATQVVCATGTHVKARKPLRISQGERVDLADFLVPGKFTVFCFTSDYGPLCREYDEPLFLLHEQRGDVAVVKVDINRPVFHQVDWESPVAKQYDLHFVPHFIIFDQNGRLVADDNTEERAARVLVDKMVGALR